MYRTERYKYIDYFTTQEYELYDLQTDPDEMHNLYADPKYADIVQKMKGRLEELRKETGDNYIYHPTKLLGRPANRPQETQ